MQYGDTRWQAWVKGQEVANEHIKAAYVILALYLDIFNSMQRYNAGIQTFDTANVCPPKFLSLVVSKLRSRVYSGLFEWCLRGYSWKCYQRTSTSPRGDRYFHQGKYTTH